MRKRRMVLIVAVVAMVMGVMAPATADGVNASDLAESGWSCVNVGVGQHCSRTDLFEFLEGGENGKALNVMVFSPDGDTFLGTEILRFSKDGLIAEHHWKAGTPPGA